MIVIRDFHGRAVQRSYNLRGIFDRSRKVALERLDIFGPNKQGGGTLGVTWTDGSTCLADFVSYGTLTQWIKRPSFKGVPVIVAESVS